MTAKILCDTNFLLVPIRFGVDIFHESEKTLKDATRFYVSSRVLDEINLLEKKAKPKFKKELAFAKKMAERCNLIYDSSCSLVDESLIHLSHEMGMILATTDSVLRKKARYEGIKVLYLRQRRYLILDG
jgi:rRNA-processing protein FCF1